ncbi:tetratricopeptide repeat protein [Cryomorpha ignava]|uniref:Tetratricopeptide repeat protein n=1 Tax=Cryomorpha ignava TaxID=101383 RepID=A0A7K3WXQ1_9FLAO|nr:tetratricopeptide repeat protein [Cryomorpha ignava]NEN25642.1 tetratricopeptide repeat protein [Cryomorpha ignava]
MKQLIYIIAFILIGFNAFAKEGTTAQAAFNQANEAYKTGNYVEALEYYHQVAEEKQGVTINYNLGNTYFKLDKLPESILHYERALKFDPSNVDVLHNLRLVNAMIVDRIDNLPQSKANIWWKEFRYGLGPDGWAWVSIGLAVLAVVLLLLYYVSPRRNIRRFGFFTGILCLFLMALTIALAQSAATYRNTHTSGVVFTDKVDIKSEPREGSTNVFVLHAGTKVSILSQDGEWYEVTIASGNQGWIKDVDFEEI